MLVLRGQESVAVLEASHETHTRHVDRMHADLASAAEAVPTLEADMTAATARYTFFQETKGYVLDLLGCLDEKVGVHLFSYL